MCNIIQHFRHESIGEIRCLLGPNNSPLFVASDVAKGLGYRDAYTMTRNLDADEKDTQNVCTPGGDQQMTVINESGFYHAALKSRAPKAVAFRKWVTSEVLPQIRMTGGYIPVAEHDDEKTIMAKAIMIMQRTLDQRAKQLEEQKPLVQFANALAASDSAISISEMAKVLTQNGYTTGRTRFYQYLREHEYIFKLSTEPCQKWVERGIFEVKTTLVETHHGAKQTITPLVTVKGQRYFLDLLTHNRSADYGK